ncbi:type II secretion system F family protein [Pygmaiobacter massiliensis]|uniref:type II secretion system F family protein n=1 Tax=Pygmaiobacter massiliensis TaxID=1917873 RepID=UPI000C798F3E|nr:hypothetical protein [Pygmaiobacter massiliensis]
MELLVFLLLAIGLLLLFGFSQQDFERRSRTKKLRQKVKAAKAKPRKGFAGSLVRDVQQILAVQGLQGAMVAVWGASVGLSICGIAVCSLFNNLFLVPVVVAVCAVTPFIVVKMRWQEQEKRMSEELEAALNSITTSYLRGNNTILSAVQENIPFIKPPVNQVFRLFVVQATLIDSRVENALLAMKQTVHNVIFYEWIDAVVRCQSDHNLKKTLPPILQKFSDARTIAAETEVIMAGPKRTYWIMLVAAVLSPAMVWFLNRDWGYVLFGTIFGKVLLALLFTVIVVTFFIAINAMQPVTAKEGRIK